MSDLIRKLIDEARRIEEDTEHSFKGHYNAASRWARYHLCIGLPSALLAGFPSELDQLSKGWWCWKLCWTHHSVSPKCVPPMHVNSEFPDWVLTGTVDRAVCPVLESRDQVGC